MSAIHITAEAGHRYLMKDGERRIVEQTTPRTIAWRLPYHSELKKEPRATFEREIESVLS